MLINARGGMSSLEWGHWPEFRGQTRRDARDINDGDNEGEGKTTEDKKAMHYNFTCIPKSQTAVEFLQMYYTSKYLEGSSIFGPPKHTQANVLFLENCVYIINLVLALCRH